MKNQYLVIHGSAATKEEAIGLCGRALYEAGVASERFADLCIKREKEYPTGLPTEIPTAIPHARDEGISKNCICFLMLDKPVAFRRMDDDRESIETKLIFNLAIKNPDEHLKALQNMMAFLNNNEALEKLQTLDDEAIVPFLQEQIG